MNKLQAAFKHVHAEEELISSTKDYLNKKRNTHTKDVRNNKLRLIIFCVALLVVLGGGSMFYFTPVSAISIEVNPSLEIGVNQLDQVISVKSYDAESEQLAASLKLKYQSYESAMNTLMNSSVIVNYLNQGEQAVITVVSQTNSSAQDIVKKINCQGYAQLSNVECRMNNSEELNEAHQVGMSVAKYEMYLQLIQYDSQLTTEEVQQMTMRQLRDLLKSYEDTSSQSHGKGHKGSNNK